MKILLSDFIKQYGPLTPIGVLDSSMRKWDKVIAFVGCDVGYDDLPEDERPDDVELAERGETKEDFSLYVCEGVPGHHFVNVERRYETVKPIPADLLVEVDNWDLLPDA